MLRDAGEFMIAKEIESQNFDELIFFVFTMQNYTASIFEESGSNMSPNMSAIVVGVIQLIGSYAATNLVDRAGRKVR